MIDITWIWFIINGLIFTELIFYFAVLEDKKLKEKDRSHWFYLKVMSSLFGFVLSFMKLALAASVFDAFNSDFIEYGIIGLKEILIFEGSVIAIVVLIGAFFGLNYGLYKLWVKK